LKLGLVDGLRTMDKSRSKVRV